MSEEKKITIVGPIGLDDAKDIDIKRKLNDLEELFRSITEQSLVGICIIQDNLIKYVNQRYAEIGGYLVEEVMNWKPGEFMKIVHPGDRKMVMAQSMKKQKGLGDVINQYQFKAIKKTGETIWLELISNSILYKGKTAVLIMIIDITEKKKTKYKLKESEYKLNERVKELTCLYGLSKLVENPDITIDGIIHETLEFIPPAWEFSNKTCTRIIYGNKEFKTNNFKETEWRLSNSTTIGEKNLRIEVYYLENRPFLEEEKYLINEIGNRLKTIIEQKEAEQRINQAHSELYQIFTASIPMYVTDLDYNIIKVNERFCNLFQLKKTEIIGKKCYDVWKGPLCDTPECSLKQILSGKQEDEYEMEKEFNGGKLISCIVKNFSFQTHNGELVGIIKSFTDITSRKTTEQKLRVSEEKYRNLIETSSMGFLNIDLKVGNIDYINPKFLEIIGYERQKLENGTLFYKILHPEDFKELIKNHDNREIEFRITSRNGKIKWLSGTRLFQYTTTGELTNLKLWVQEITEKKKIEHKLRESEQKFRFLFENSPNSIFLFDRKGIIKDLNPTAENIFHYKKEEIIGKRFMRIQWFYPEDLPFVMETFKQLLNGEIPKPFEMQQRKKDGTYIWVHVLFSFINIGTEEYIQVIAQDISLIKESETKLKESEEKYRGVLENIKEGYFEVNLEGNFIFFNDALCKSSGYSREELLNKSYSMVFDEETKEKIFRVYNDLYKKGEGFTLIEYQILKKNGMRTYYESSVYLRYSSDGDIIGFKGFVRDISERKKAEALRKKFSRELEKEVDLRTKELKVALDHQKLYLDQILKASHFKTEFMATMSHELRTPLNAIIGFTDLILEGVYGKLNSEQLEYIKDIEESSKHLLDMITHILDISKIESGQVTVTIDKIQLSNIIEQVISTLKPLYSKKNLKVEIRGLRKKQTIYADLLKLKQIIYNLLSNAIKFTERGIVSIEFLDKKDYWEFYVKDTGIGIAEKDYDIIFKDFKRVRSPYVDSMPGSGLGLSLTKRIIQLHGGEISFTSKIGKGTTFSFYIPKKIKNIDSRLRVESLLKCI